MEESTLIMSNINRGNVNEVTVIIATTAEKKREAQILTAISSVLTQQECQFQLLLIINGSRFEPSLRNSLENNNDITCHYLKEGNFPKALIYARSLVDTEFFCFLDDDDELLPSSLIERLTAFKAFPDSDVVVGNGLKKHNTELELETHSEILNYQENPLKALFRANGNWLASCAGMFRTKTISPEYFKDYAVYAEWTYIAFKLALYKKIIFIDDICYRINVNVESLSHTENYLQGQYNMTRKVLALPLPKWARYLFLVKKRDMEHDLAERYMKNKDMWKAWEYHLKSLCNYKTFFKYILFTRYLISKSV